MANKTLHGKWFTPTPVVWVDDEEMNGETPEGVRCFATQRGHMKMRVEKKEVKAGVFGTKVVRFVTLTEEETGAVCKGQANVKYDRIHFENGATWIREKVKPDIPEDDRPGPQIQEEAIHAAAPFCGFCGAKSMPEDSEANAEDAPLPPPRSTEEGFFAEDQLEDIIDRINDAVGIWGFSEAKEREYIKPPVVSMNKIIQSCLETFLDNPIVELFQYFMDETLEMAQKAKAFGNFLYNRFVKPLADALLERLLQAYEQIEWMKDHVSKVVQLMAQMVTDELVSKTLEGMNDAEVVDLEGEAPDA